MPETPAQELREAAKRVRADASWPSEALMLALGDLLDAEAKSADLHADGVMVPRAPVRAALAVARAYPGTKAAPVPETASYAQAAIDAIEAELPGLPEGLAHLYALLVLAKGAETTIEDIHDAWSLWRVETRPDHPSIIPFAALTAAKQELDRPYLEGVHRAAERLITKGASNA